MKEEIKLVWKHSLKLGVVASGCVAGSSLFSLLFLQIVYHKYVLHFELGDAVHMRAIEKT